MGPIIGGPEYGGTYWVKGYGGGGSPMGSERPVNSPIVFRRLVKGEKPRLEIVCSTGDNGLNFSPRNLEGGAKKGGLTPKVCERSYTGKRVPLGKFGGGREMGTRGGNTQTGSGEPRKVGNTGGGKKRLEGNCQFKGESTQKKYSPRGGGHTKIKGGV